MNNQSGIYKITNNINGKFYIGSTTNLRHRWWSHRTQANKGCVKLHNALDKHGKDNFQIEMVETIECPEGLTRENQQKLWDREQYYLDALQPFGSRGYNICTAANNGYRQVGSHCHDHNKAVSQFDLNGNWVRDFESMKEAAEYEKICDTSITDCCKGIKKSAGGYMWKLLTTERKIPPYKNNVRKPVNQYTLTGELVKTWESGKTAAITLKILPSGITDCCKGRLKTSGGFRWKYAT